MKKKKKLKKLGLKFMMSMLQKRPKFGMKMHESWLFMDQFPPLDLKAFFLSWCPHSKNYQNLAWKWLNLSRLLTDFLQTYHIISFLVHASYSVKSKQKKKILKKLGLKLMITTLRKQPKFNMKMAESRLFMNQFPPKHHRMFFLVHNNHSVISKIKKRKNIEETRSKSIFCHGSHAPKTAEIWHENGRISTVYG